MLPLMLQAAPPPAVPAPAVDDEIVVIGKRLRDWRGRFRMHDGKPECRTTRSTGDKAIDAIGCEAMVQCYGPLQARVEQMTAQVKDKAERTRRLQQIADGQVQCLKDARQAGIAKLAEERVQ
ncbi:hypothetical protein [Stakelama marina]|uniref:Uncharacterized protein n=1 Tax=Stakelama marina TaxID=2826939 RepID=A0A8T4IFG3_9SPHN|nr:hypothetical protein [Stakelama marina]MBR0552604.1 hypothetical protein [Stakelama marina]